MSHADCHKQTMCDAETLSLSIFSSYHRTNVNFLDVGVEIFLYDREWKYKFHCITCNFILSNEYINTQHITKLKDIIDEYVNVHILSDRNINIKSFNASYVEQRGKVCYFTPFTKEKTIKRINLKYKSNNIYSDPINYINCSNCLFKRHDVYVSIRVCETHKLDKDLPNKYHIQKFTSFYKTLTSILNSLNLVLSGIFVIYENRYYVCTPYTIDYFNSSIDVKEEFLNIYVWTKRK